MTRTALYPGSFDPVTNGHIDVIRQVLGFADSVVVAIGVHHEKSAFLSYETRAELIGMGCRALLGPGVDDRIRVASFKGLVVDVARENGAGLLVRGVRNGTDFDYEMQMVGMNSAMGPELQTIFVPASKDVRHISSSLVRQVAELGGDISPFVPEEVDKRLKSEN